ncbi:regulator of chromosome condensation [Holotrichia oblita]|uniref:Regulator of chromosome condensation n=1 Tax=Holotrichia oblita TaxID=644536 RepID=A0ACB9T5D4_HOLOL|nr:regulator of chromosome condensation [Holotrichia oblita]
MSQFLLQDIFELKCLVRNIDVRLNCRIENGVKQLLALVTNDGDIILHYNYGELPSVFKRIPWFTESSKIIQAICFDPTATWLLVVCLDASLYIIPALSLVDKKQKIDCKWSVNDITYFPKHVNTPESKPLCAVWWQTLECNQNALVGHENGSIGLISLTDGRCLGSCSVNEAITHLYLCQDNSLDSVSLLINSSGGQQYRLILEQPSTGYLWPPEANNAVDDSNKSRLYNLKQMSVDKFYSFKQRIVEGRGTRRDSQASESPSESSHSDVSSQSVPELLPRLCDTYFAPQYARNRYLFSAYYKPTTLLTVHASDVESAPLYVHKLPQNTNTLLLTDRLIYTTNDELNSVSIISTQLSESPLEGDSEFNPYSLIAQFNVENQSEKILNVYKFTDVTLDRARWTKDDKKESSKTFVLPKSVNDLNIHKVKIDTCVIVTTNSVYKLIVSCSPINKFIKLVNEEWNLERAEYLSIVFSLNLQQLLESCGDLLISNGTFHQGLILYKQAKTHLLKRVLKLAVTADCKALLKFVNLCLSASKVDMSMATKIHIGNLAVMAYTELVLRFGGHLRTVNKREFMNFLYYEEYYDQVLAVNVACQAAHWGVVTLLAKSRGLQPEVVAALSQIIQTSRIPKTHDHEFLLTLSEPSLSQSLLIYPAYCQVILAFIRLNVQHFPVDILKRFVLQLDPSQPSAFGFDLDSADLENSPQTAVVVREFVETFIMVLVALIGKSETNYFNISLLENTEIPDWPIEEKEPIKKFPDLKPICCGNEHAAIVRNNCVFMMGIANSGCLGLGPLLTQTSPPRLVQTLADLKVKILGYTGWGSNAYGQLGLGQYIRETPYPQIISALRDVNVIDVVTGQYHSMGLTSHGSVYTWGWGIHGQLGHGSCNNEFYPKLLHFDYPIVQIAAGHAHSLILTSEGKLYGFGSNAFGQLENCDIDGSKATKPTWVVIMPEIYICIRDKEVYTWGANPQEVRLSQSKYSQKLITVSTKLYEPWKNSLHIYTSVSEKPIEQVAVGFRHSAILHNGKLLWNRNVTWKILRGKHKTRKQNDYVTKYKRRVVKFPQNNQNGEAYPVEVPGLPTMAITFNSSDHRLFHLQRNRARSIFSIENINFETNIDINSKPFIRNSLNFDYLHRIPNFKLTSKTLHYVLETYYGYYDTENILSKCIDFENYQAASKIALLDGHYSDSLGFQLAAFKKYMDKFQLDLNAIPKYKDLYEKNEDDSKKVDSNKTSLGKFELNIINNSPAHILSSSSSLDSIRQWDDLEHQGGLESPCEMAEIGDVKYSVSQYMQSMKHDSPPITSVSKMISSNTVIEENPKEHLDIDFKDNNLKDVVEMASKLIEFYIRNTYASENHILMQTILLKCIEFWLSNSLPVSSLEKVLLKNMDKYFYPLSILLFCKNFNNNLGEEIIKKEDETKQQKSTGFLKQFSTKFCLQLCSMVLENANKA